MLFCARLIAALSFWIGACHVSSPQAQGERCSKEVLASPELSPEVGYDDIRAGRFINGDWVTSVAGRLHVTGHETTLCADGEDACIHVDTSPLHPVDPSCNGLWVRLDGEALDPTHPALRAYAIAVATKDRPPPRRDLPVSDPCGQGVADPAAQDIELGDIDASRIGQRVRVHARLWTPHTDVYGLVDEHRKGTIAFDGLLFHERCSNVRVIAEGVVTAGHAWGRHHATESFFLHLTYARREQ